MTLLRPAGPVANAYEQSRASISCIVGPTGGGKTEASAKKVVRVAQWQHPSPRDGIRKARVVCVTPTYREAWKGPIPSWKKVAARLGVFDPKTDKAINGARWTGGRNDPAEHVFDLMWPGLGQLHIELWFRAIGDEKLEEFVRGLECTAFWLPEMDTLPADLMTLAPNRAGRFPEPEDRPAPGSMPDEAYKGVFGDANVPDLDSWFYDQWWLAGARKEHWAFFRQPAGLLESGLQNPAAENLDNLRKIDPNFYPNQAADMPKWAVKRLLKCRPGYSRHGEPVHEAFDEDRHVAKATLRVDPRLPVIIGVDGGGNTTMPAAIFMQRTRFGQWRVLDVFMPDSNTSITELGKAIKDTMRLRFHRAQGAVIMGDPAMIQTQAANGRTYAQLLQAESGIEVRMAPSQDPATRRAALSGRTAGVLNRRGGGGEELFIVCPTHCGPLIKALAGGFHYRLADKAKGRLIPVKNHSSHGSEATEYGVLGGDGIEGWGDGLMGLDGDMSGGAHCPAPILA